MERQQQSVSCCGWLCPDFFNRQDLPAMPDSEYCNSSFLNSINYSVIRKDEFPELNIFKFWNNPAKFW